MVIGFLSFEIFLPYAASLKEKRKALNSLKDRVRRKYNVALAEVDFQDKWQRSRVGVVTLNSDKTVVAGTLDRVVAEAEQTIDGEILNAEIRYF